MIRFMISTRCRSISNDSAVTRLAGVGVGVDVLGMVVDDEEEDVVDCCWCVRERVRRSSSTNNLCARWSAVRKSSPALTVHERRESKS